MIELQHIALEDKETKVERYQTDCKLKLESEKRLNEIRSLLTDLFVDYRVYLTYKENEK